MISHCVGSSVPPVAGLGAVAAALGLGGFAFLSNNKADPAGGAKKAAKRAGPNVSVCQPRLAHANLALPPGVWSCLIIHY